MLIVEKLKEKANNVLDKIFQNNIDYATKAREVINVEKLFYTLFNNKENKSYENLTKYFDNEYGKDSFTRQREQSPFSINQSFLLNKQDQFENKVEESKILPIQTSTNTKSTMAYSRKQSNNINTNINIIKYSSKNLSNFNYLCTGTNQNANTTGTAQNEFNIPEFKQDGDTPYFDPLEKSIRRHRKFESSHEINFTNFKQRFNQSNKKSCDKNKSKNCALKSIEYDENNKQTHSLVYVYYFLIFRQINGKCYL